VSFWPTGNPRPDTVRPWLVVRVCLLAALGGAGAWFWVTVVLAWCAADYALWFARRKA
jgi:hypothetical protein